MHVAYQSFWLPKAGNTDVEYEDAFWPMEDYNSFADEVKIAIADGATETSFARLWANQLVRDHCEGMLGEDLPASLPELRKQWHEQIQTVPLAWYAEEKARSGAFSSLLGLTIRAGQSDATPYGRWDALAIGDSCLFQVRHEVLVARFPLTTSEDFNNRPRLLSSIYTPEDAEQPFVLQSGDWQLDDAFYLMTDALACWFLRECEQGGQPWAILRDLDTKDASISFPDLIAQLRADRQIRNDDVTLCRIEVY
jgi:hypothetical protein